MTPAPFSPTDLNNLRGPWFGNRIAHMECRGKRRLGTTQRLRMQSLGDVMSGILLLVHKWNACQRAHYNC